MNSRHRVVNVVPVQALWTEDGEVTATRGRWLGRDAIRELLRGRPVRFVVANLGHPLTWVPVAERFEFWRTDASLHVCDSERVDLDNFPGGAAYVASEWLSREGEQPIVLLGKCNTEM